jgi:hypothetical protein
MLKTLWNDESGVILSAEIVLVATILVLGMIVGLVELQSAVVFELNDLADAFGDLSQQYETTGFRSGKAGAGANYKATTVGSEWLDQGDSCDLCSLEIVCDNKGETP